MTINTKVSEIVIPRYVPVLRDIMNHEHVHYIFPGGRGSTKSSFVSEAIPLLIAAYPDIHATCFRKIGNTVQKSIFAQMVWGIYKLGLEDAFKIPKTFASPIIFKQTGQQIIFMGLDDPNKVKSIKLPFGYIGITWFEELDQYSGENELRKVTQSTMRGGDRFWDFRTFNPPISKNNWANEYTDDCEVYRQDDTLVVRNDYRDVPVDWLGDQFIEEAERLKEMNERAYIHEYLGQAIGTGGDVFPNVVDIDTDQMVAIKDAAGKTLKEIPMWETFDKIYNGIDWGFAIDPFRFVRCHFDNTRRDLYIFREFSCKQTRNKEIFDIIYDEKKLVRRDEQVIADSAEPKSIADFRAYGGFVREAAKGPDSVRYGIKWLQGLSHIYIDKRHCPETYKEFVEYEYEQDRDGNFIPAYPDENNHSIDAVRYAMEKYANKKGN